LVAARNSRSGAPSNLGPMSSRSSLMFLSVNDTAQSSGVIPDSWPRLRDLSSGLAHVFDVVRKPQPRMSPFHQTDLVGAGKEGSATAPQTVPAGPLARPSGSRLDTPLPTLLSFDPANAHAASSRRCASRSPS